jgi:hypothetical protein
MKVPDMFLFSMSEKENEKSKKWIEKHSRKCKLEYPLITYKFTPTGIGDVIIIQCQCGKEKDVTDVSNW